jgi:ATP-binding cassette, subfamily F, member 3
MTGLTKLTPRYGQVPVPNLNRTLRIVNVELVGPWTSRAQVDYEGWITKGGRRDAYSGTPLRLGSVYYGPVIELRQFALRRGAKALFTDATFTIARGMRVGVIGRNGSGKTSLLAAILGQLHADEGELVRPPNLVVAHVAQHAPSGAQTALDTVLDGDVELRAVEAELEVAETENDGTRIGRAHGRLEDIDGYTAPSRARRILTGLGFTAHERGAPVDSFSGGWRMRISLAQALMARSDLLLLDEPTNHLDLDAVVWLESWLEAYRGTLILISHDRDFLDRVVTHVAHIDNAKMRFYTGNFSSFERQRAEAMARDQAMATRQARRRAEIQSFVDRFRYKASKARQAQSRLKSLERMANIELANADRSIRFSIPVPSKLPTPLVRLDRVSAGYGGPPVIADVSLTLEPGTRIGLIGPNGAGKSTLIKLLGGILEASNGDSFSSNGLVVGYFAQHQLELLDERDSAISTIRRMDADTPEQALRDHLGGFGFPGTMADSPITTFSGGERARLVLATLVWQRPNVLLLDEPTNHLDLDMRDALAHALQDYPGALVTVSHDRHLLSATTDELWLVNGGKVTPYKGDLDDYRVWLLSDAVQRHDASATPLADARATTENNAAPDRRQTRQQEAEARRARQPLKRRADALESSIDSLGARLAKVELSLAEPTLYDPQSKDELKALLIEQGKLRDQIEETEMEWLEASEALESFGV